MKDLECKIVNTIKKYNMIEKGDRIVLAVSGGPDSMCMLNAFIEIQKENSNCQSNSELMKIVVAHVNHMIRDEASEDERFVKNFCEKNHIEFYSKSIDVQKIAHNRKDLQDIIFLRKFYKKQILIKLQLLIIKMIMQKQLL